MLVNSFAVIFFYFSPITRFVAIVSVSHTHLQVNMNKVNNEITLFSFY